jgi:hypothetical protein
MLTPNAKTIARKEAFRRIGAAITRRAAQGPTLFNPHYQIRARAVADRELSSSTGPQLKTQQWEPTGRRGL